MEKVKLTQEQADAIKKRDFSKEINRFNFLKCYITGGWDGKLNRCLNYLNIEELARAVYIGYEVMPEFKVGDWVYVEVPKEELPNVYKIMNAERYSVNLDRLYGNYKKSDIRHATTEEISEEKRRRWWAKHGRDVRELRSGDVLVFIGEVYRTVKYVTNEHLDLSEGDRKELDIIEKMWDLGNVKVVCFVEDREDVRM